MLLKENKNEILKENVYNVYGLKDPKFYNASFLSFTYRFNVIPIKTPVAFFVRKTSLFNIYVMAANTWSNPNNFE